MKRNSEPGPPFWWYPVETLVRFLVFLVATVAVSAVYKGIIELEFFQIISGSGLRRAVFCGV